MIETMLARDRGALPLIRFDHSPTLLDEGDAIFNRKAGGNTEGLRAVLNAGNRRGTTVPRVSLEAKHPKLLEFDVFCPKAIAGIGRIPETVADRSMA